MSDSKLSLLNANRIELHYWFTDDTHTMDAVVENRCEYEFLAIVREIAKKYGLEVVIETEPLAEGGLRRWFRLVSKAENKSAIITTALVTALATSVIITPINTIVGKFTEKWIEQFFEDDELKELEKEKLKLEIKKLRSETNSYVPTLNEDNKIRKRRSNFYDALDKYPKIKEVSFSLQDEEKIVIDKELVLRKNFRDFILASDELEPIEVENATIEIVAPVLKKGNYKWIGIYDGQVYHFNMKSAEFKSMVQTDKISFRNGSSINCTLLKKRKIDSEGAEIITGIDVVRVNHYFENDQPIETPEGKKHRQKQEAQEMQFSLFQDPTDDN